MAKKSIKRLKRIVRSGISQRKLKRNLKKPIKRLAALFLSALMLFATGCGRLGEYSEPEDISVVSAIGFDKTENGVRVSFQSVGAEGSDPRVTHGEGESVSLALSSLYGKASKKYELSHCAIIALGEGISAQLIDEIFLLCEYGNEISDAVLWLCTDSAEKLLSLENSSGYDVTSAMRSTPNGTGLFSKNRFYEIKSEEIESAEHSVMALPYFQCVDGAYSPIGLKLYQNRLESLLLNRRESVIYLIMSGIFTSGRVEYTHDGKEKSISVTDCRIEERQSSNSELYFRLSTKETLTDTEKTAISDSLRLDAHLLHIKLVENGHIPPHSAEFFFEIENEK